MKLLVQSDDFGITKAVSLGCVEGIRNGVIRNTGMFANMPWIEECTDWIRPYLNQIAFGIDLNASTGPSILGHDRIPHLTHEDGTFLGSRENNSLDTEENGFDHLKEYRDELKAEFEAQILKYISLIGHNPDYIHNHAYGKETTMSVTRELVEKYHCQYSDDMVHRDNCQDGGMGWYAWGGPEDQLKNNPIRWFTTDQPNMLKKQYGYIICHCGYADGELFDLSSFNACRVRDLQCMLSDEMKNWIRDNQIELITFRDLPDEYAR